MRIAETVCSGVCSEVSSQSPMRGVKLPLLRKRVLLVAHSRRPRRDPVDDLWTITGYENLV